MSTEAVADLVQQLEQHPFTQGFPRPALAKLAQVATVQTFQPGTFLLREGREADHFYLLLGGQAAIELYLPERGVIRLQTVGPGDVVGWSWLLPPYRAAFDVSVINTVEAITFDAAKLRQVLEDDPALAARFLRQLVHVIAQRVHATRLQLIDMYGTQGGGR